MRRATAVNVSDLHVLPPEGIFAIKEQPGFRLMTVDGQTRK